MLDVKIRTSFNRSLVRESSIRDALVSHEMSSIQGVVAAWLSLGDKDYSLVRHILEQSVARVEHLVRGEEEPLAGNVP